MKILKVVMVVSLAGCAGTVDRTTQLTGGDVAGYNPTVDLVTSGRTAEQYAVDRSQCLALAQNKQAQETRNAGQEVAANTLASTVAGAGVGALVGIVDPEIGAGNAALIGASTGLVGGAASAITSSTQVSRAARDTADKCLRGRGYTVL